MLNAIDFLDFYNAVLRKKIIKKCVIIKIQTSMTLYALQLEAINSTGIFLCLHKYQSQINPKYFLNMCAPCTLSMVFKRAINRVTNSINIHW